MKVTVISMGRFHSFEMVHQLEKNDVLKEFITIYPKNYVAKWGIPKNKIRSFIIIGALYRLILKTPPNLCKPLTYLIYELYDIIISLAFKKDTDILLAWSGICEKTLKKANKKGIMTIVERGSCHILKQNELLKNEYEKLEISFKYVMNSSIMSKELKEYQIADYISVPSEFVVESFLHYGLHKDKILKNPYGVNLSLFKKIEKKDNVFRIIHCGAISIQKGVLYLIDAFNELNLKNSELYLIGTISSEIKSIIEEHIKENDNIKLIGQLPQSELHNYFSQGSVFCLASIQEGFGMVITQAMACQLPVIHTHNTGGSELIQDGISGFAVQIASKTALKDRLHFLYDDNKTCQKMGKNALERVKTGFTWDDYGNRMIYNFKRISKAKNIFTNT